MLGWLSVIPGLVSGLFSTVNTVTNAIANERIKHIEAKTDQERIHSEERIKTLEARRSIMLSKSNQWETRALMAAFGVGPAFMLSKIYIWDKALGQWTNGSTDPLDENLWWVITAQIGFYFLASTALRVFNR